MLNKIILIALITFIDYTLAAQDTLQSILTALERPAVHHFHVNLVDELNNQSAMPIAVIKGKAEGPVFTAVAGVHGFEYPPIIAAQALIQAVDPNLLTGTLIIVPMANPNAFYQRTPFLNPQDSLNLNRVFPGSETGTITERIADYLTHSIIAQSDVFVDIHGGDANEDLLPFVCYYDNQSKPVQTQRVQELTQASGFKHIVAYPYTLKADQPAKYGFKQAVQDGKVALSIECGKLGNVQADAVELIKTGIFNMLAEMKMYPSTSNEQPDFVELNQQAYIKSQHQGTFQSEYVAGDSVKKGAVVGYINNEFGETQAEIIAPTTGIIFYKIGTPPVNHGETLMCIGYRL